MRAARSLFAVLCITLSAFAQSSADASAAPAKYDGWTFNALADVYYTANMNHPASNANQVDVFNIHAAQPELSLAKLTIDKSDALFGLHIDAGFGEAMRLMHATDPAALDHRALRYFEQAYAIVKPKHAHGVEIDFGQFVTSAGVELIESNANWNYSDSLLFALALPYYHFGLRASIPVTRDFTAGVQLVNAWNTVWGNNNLNNVGVTTALTKRVYTWSVNYYGGPNHEGTTTSKRNLLETSLQLRPCSSVRAYVDFAIGRDGRVAPNSGHDEWLGIASAAQFQLAKRIALTPRAEWFNDQTGFATGRAQQLKEVTLTGEYKLTPQLLSRVEFRRDWSNIAYFDRGAQTAAARAQSTLTLALIIALGPYR